MAAVDMTKPIDTKVLPVEEQRRTLQSDLNAHLQTIERQKLDYQRSMELGDTARMQSAQLAADQSAAQAEIIRQQIAELEPKVLRAAATPKRKGASAKAVKK